MDWKEKETCPQPLVTGIGSERQDLQTNRHRKEGISWRTNLQVSIKEWKKTAVYPGFQAINTLCCILDILISFRTAQGTDLSISSFLTALCDPCAPALHSWPLMKTLLKLKQTKLCQLVTKAQWKPDFIGVSSSTNTGKGKAVMQEQEINGFFTLLQSLQCFCGTTADEGGLNFLNCQPGPTPEWPVP